TLGTAVALENLKMMGGEDYENLGTEKGAWVLEGLKNLQHRHVDMIGDVDGPGLPPRLESCGADGLTPDRPPPHRIFAEGLKGDLVSRGRKYGLVLDGGGYHKNVFTLAPSFTMTRDEVELALELLDQLFRRCRRN